MFKILTIARREFAAMVATKAFAFTLVLMPVLMFGGLVLMPTLQKLGGTKERRIVIADGTGVLFELIDQAAGERNQMMLAAAPKTTGDAISKGRGNENPFDAPEVWKFEASADPELTDEQRLSLSQEIRDGKLYAFVEIPPSVSDVTQQTDDKVTFVSQDAALSGARRWLAKVLQGRMRVMRLTALGIDPDLAMQADVPLPVQAKMPYSADEQGQAKSEGGADILLSMMLPFGIMMLMFMVVLLAAQPMLESGMEEKSDRIAELLLGSVSATELMTGKLLGNVAGSLVVFAVYGIGGWIVLYQNEWATHLPWTLMPWLIVFQLLGVLFFSSIFLAIGASVSELKEAQSLLLPVWMLLAMPLMVWFIAVRDPNGVVAVTLSFFPPSTPLMMSLRLAVGQTMPAWHAPAAALLMFAATYGVIQLAGRIYRASLLKTDSAKTVRQLFRRLTAAE